MLFNGLLEYRLIERQPEAWCLRRRHLPLAEGIAGAVESRDGDLVSLGVREAAERARQVAGRVVAVPRAVVVRGRAHPPRVEPSSRAQPAREPVRPDVVLHHVDDALPHGRSNPGRARLRN